MRMICYGGTVEVLIENDKVLLEIMDQATKETIQADLTREEVLALTTVLNELAFQLKV